MFHPPDPTDLRQNNVHISMKVNIVTDGPSGLQFSQSVQAGPFQTFGCVSNFSPDFHQNFTQETLSLEPEHLSNMVSWPSYENTEFQAADNRLVVRNSAGSSRGTSSSSKSSSRGTTSDKPSHSHQSHHRCSQRHSHDHHRDRRGGHSTNHKTHHGRHNHNGADRKILQQQEKINYASILSHIAPDLPQFSQYSIKSMLPCEKDRPEEHKTKPQYLQRAKNDERLEIVQRPANLENSEKIRIFPTDNGHPPGLYQKRVTQLEDRKITNESSLTQSIFYKSADENLPKNYAIQNSAGNSEIRNSHCSTELALNPEPIATNVPDMIRALMDPLLKLSEHLSATKEALADPKNLGVDEESNLEIKTMVTAWKKKIDKSEPEKNAKNLAICDKIDKSVQNIKNARKNMPEAKNFVPFETLINDVGIESKEVQTSSEIFNKVTELAQHKTGKLATTTETQTMQILDNFPPENFTKSDFLGPSVLEKMLNAKSSEIPKFSDTLVKDQSEKSINFEVDRQRKKVELFTLSDENVIKNFRVKELQRCGIENFDKIDSTAKSSNEKPPICLKAGSTVFVKPGFGSNPLVGSNPIGNPQEPGFLELIPQTEISNVSKNMHKTFAQDSISAGSIFQLLTKDPSLYRFGLQSCVEDGESENLASRPIPPPRNFYGLKRDLYTVVELPESPLSSRSAKTSTSSRSNLKHKSTQNEVKHENSNFYDDNLSCKSINTERSSLSGRNRAGAFKISELEEGCVDENLRDYSQDNLSIHEQTIGDDDSNTVTSYEGDSVASETSLTAEHAADYCRISPLVEQTQNESLAMSQACVARSFRDILQLQDEKNEFTQKPVTFTDSKFSADSAVLDGTIPTVIGISPNRSSSFTRAAEVVLRRRVEEQGFLDYVRGEVDSAQCDSMIPVRVDWRSETEEEQFEQHKPRKNLKQTAL